MDTAHTPLSDPAALLEQLDADAIRHRIDEIDHERQALLVLLRAAQRMKRDKPAAMASA
jgi:hypothetical protein